MTVRCVDATGVRCATCTVQDGDRSGLTTYTARVPSHGLTAVLTEAGDITTVDIMKTCPLPATMIPVRRLMPLAHKRHSLFSLQLQHDHRFPQDHPTVQASFFDFIAYLFIYSFTYFIHFVYKRKKKINLKTAYR